MSCRKTVQEAREYAEANKEAIEAYERYKRERNEERSKQIRESYNDFVQLRIDITKLYDDFKQKYPDGADSKLIIEEVERMKQNN